MNSRSAPPRASSETAFEAYLARDTRGEFRDLGATAGSISMGAVSVGRLLDPLRSRRLVHCAVTKGTWYDSDARSPTGPLLHTHGFGWAGSLEGGYPIALVGCLVLEPRGNTISACGSTMAPTGMRWSRSTTATRCKAGSARGC
jgi:hypothetical protein